MDKYDLCGMEVSAAELLVRVERQDGSQEERSFANRTAGHKKLLKFVQRAPAPLRVCLESTGVYGLDIATLLARQNGIEVLLGNPRDMRAFATTLTRCKTDRLDARSLLEYVRRMPFQKWQPPSDSARQLWAVTRRMATVKKLCAAEKNRLHAACSTQELAMVREEIRRAIRNYQASLQRLRRQAMNILAADPELQQRYDWLTTVRGIGKVSALAVLGELSLLPQDLTVRQWVAFAGLDPQEHESGTSVHRRVRISKAGNARLREALFYPALSATKASSPFHPYYQHLVQDNGKAPMVAITAMMRKLLHVIYGMFENQQEFDPAKLRDYRKVIAPDSQAAAA